MAKYLPRNISRDGILSETTSIRNRTQNNEVTKYLKQITEGAKYPKQNIQSREAIENRKYRKVADRKIRYRKTKYRKTISKWSNIERQKIEHSKYQAQIIECQYIESRLSNKQKTRLDEVGFG